MFSSTKIDSRCLVIFGAPDRKSGENIKRKAIKLNIYRKLLCLFFFLALGLLSTSSLYSFRLSLSNRRIPIIKSPRLFSSTSPHLPVSHEKVKYEAILKLSEKLQNVSNAIVNVEAKIDMLNEEMKSITANQIDHSMIMEIKLLQLKKAIKEIEEYKKTESKLDQALEKALGKSFF